MTGIVANANSVLKVVLQEERGAACVVELGALLLSFVTISMMIVTARLTRGMFADVSSILIVTMDRGACPSRVMLTASMGPDVMTRYRQ
jgi:hypothetical protein